MSDTAPERLIPDSNHAVDIDVPLGEIWTANPVNEAGRTETEQELVDMLTGVVEDPEATAREAYDEFMQRMGGGGSVLLVASFREELSDESVLSASLLVNRNELTGSLEHWAAAYDDAEERTVAGAPAIRVFEETPVMVEGLFDEPLTACTWRYIVEWDKRSTVLFSFTSPNAELREILEEHFDTIMDGVTITPSEEESED